MSDIILRTMIPILLLMGTGFISRKLGILKSGDERILSAYVYYFALPALFFVNMTETDFTEETLIFLTLFVLAQCLKDKLIGYPRMLISSLRAHDFMRCLRLR